MGCHHPDSRVLILQDQLLMSEVSNCRYHNPSMLENVILGTIQLDTILFYPQMVQILQPKFYQKYLFQEELSNCNYCVNVMGLQLLPIPLTQWCTFALIHIPMAYLLYIFGQLYSFFIILKYKPLIKVSNTQNSCTPKQLVSLHWQFSIICFKFEQFPRHPNPSTSHLSLFPPYNIYLSVSNTHIFQVSDTN